MDVHFLRLLRQPADVHDSKTRHQRPASQSPQQHQLRPLLTFVWVCECFCCSHFVCVDLSVLASGTCSTDRDEQKNVSTQSFVLCVRETMCVHGLPKIIFCFLKTVFFFLCVLRTWDCSWSIWLGIGQLHRVPSLSYFIVMYRCFITIYYLQVRLAVALTTSRPCLMPGPTWRMRCMGKASPLTCLLPEVLPPWWTQTLLRWEKIQNFPD